MEIGLQDLLPPLGRSLAEAPFRAAWLGAHVVGRAIKEPLSNTYDLMRMFSDAEHSAFARDLPAETPGRTVERVRSELAAQNGDMDPQLRLHVLAEGIGAALSARQVVEIPPSERRQLASNMLAELRATDPSLLDVPSREDPDKTVRLFGAEAEQLMQMIETPEQ